MNSVYFEPENDNAGLYYLDTNGYLLYYLFRLSMEWTIYFKYKVDKENLDKTGDFAPIISYRQRWPRDVADRTTKPFLIIQDSKFFSISADDDNTFFSRDVSYTFNGKWHTCCITRKDKWLRIFIDGYCSAKYDVATNGFEFGDEMFLGYQNYGNTVITFQGGSLDDFNITQGCVYESHHIAPTEYFWNADIVTNYYENDPANVDNLEDDVKHKLDRLEQHSTYQLNEFQKGWLPRRLAITWYEDDTYFKDEKFTYHTTRSRDYTIVHVTNVDNPFFTVNDRFLEINALKGIENQKILPFMCFLNRCFVKVSKIKIIKSDNFYTFVFTDRDPYFNDPVKSFEIVILPFPVIYEEDYGERPDMLPLYSFDENGKFSPGGGISFYYIDSNRIGNKIKSIGSREDYIPQEELDREVNLNNLIASINKGNTSPNTDNILEEKDMMRFVWRHGKLELIRIANDGVGAFMYFMAWDHGWIDPTDKVVMYLGSTVVDPSKYKVIGYDLIYFYDYKDLNVNTSRNVTLQVIAEPTPDWLFADYTKIRYVEVEATLEHQYVFNIPEVLDDDGHPFRDFLIFRGGVFMGDQDRYEIDYENMTVRFLRDTDYVSKGRHICFVFVKLNHQNASGRLHVKPYMYTTFAPIYNIEILDDPSFKYNDHFGVELPGLLKNIHCTHSNVLVFQNGLFVNPNRYTIDEKHKLFIFLDPNDSGTMNLGHPKRMLTFVVLRIVDAFADPISVRDKVIKEQILQGSRFILYDLNIPKNMKITLDNLICFDQNGEYIPDLIGKIYNLNIIKHLKTSDPVHRFVRFLTCVYSPVYSLENFANAIRPDNTNFLKNYIKLYKEFNELDSKFDTLMADFDEHYRTSHTYGANLARMLDHVVTYNQSLLDSVYESNTTATRRTYNTATINNMSYNVGGMYRYRLERDNYSGNNWYRTYPLVFQDGKLASWYKNTTYTNNATYINMPTKLPSGALVESLHAHKMVNFLMPVQSKATKVKEINACFDGRVVAGTVLNYFWPTNVPTTVNKVNVAMCNRSYSFIGQVYVEEPLRIHIDPIFFDTFKGRVHVSALLNKDVFPGKVEVEDVPNGVVVDLSRFNMIYEFTGHMEVPGPVGFEFTCTVEVDDW